MQKEICFTIDSDVYEKLTMALQLSGEDQESVLENCVKSYIAKTFGEISEEYSLDKKRRLQIEIIQERLFKEFRLGRQSRIRTIIKL